MKVETRLALVLTTEKILAIIKVLKKDIKKGLNETQKSQNFGFKSNKKRNKALTIDVINDATQKAWSKS